MSISFLLIYLFYQFININMEKKMFTTQLNNDLLKEFKKLAIDLERPINDILEEAIKDFLKKNEKKPTKPNK